MGRVEDLAAKFASHIRTPWQRTLAGEQRVIMVVYPKELESTFIARRSEFEQAAVEAGHPWIWCDLTTAFSEWMAENDERENCFRLPEDLRMPLGSEFVAFVTDRIRAALKTADENTVVGVMGVSGVFGFIHMSDVLPKLSNVPGRLAVFFPGHKQDTNYRLLDARDGWTYLAVGITL